MRAWLLGFFGLILSAAVGFGIIYYQKPKLNQSVQLESAPTPMLGSHFTPSTPEEPKEPIEASTPLPSQSSDHRVADHPSDENSTQTPTAQLLLPPTPTASTLSSPEPDLTVDDRGLSKATVVVTTQEGIIKFKFYSKDAPKTIKRIVELIQQGFYNGLSFHRVVPGFVIQGGDPIGNGTGGSGQKLEAEFNQRHHVEGAVAMARASDPNSADSQFYITMGTFPHLDHAYTIFGQVIEGMEVVKKIKVGDKMTSVTLQ